MRDAVETTFWVALWRAPAESEAREAARALAAGQPEEHLVQRLLASTEFRVLLGAVRADADTGRHLGIVARALDGLGDHDAFVRTVYRVLLGREGDEGGCGYYRGRLASGESRISVLTTFLRCDEFAERHRRLTPQAGTVPRDVQLCELANPAKWDNPDWLALLSSLAVVPADKLSMHRKAYEFTQLLFGLTRLGCVHETAGVLSVGAGHEPVLYWLANHAGRVVATDMYEGAWRAEGAMEGDASMVVDPSPFAPFPYRKERLACLRMDGRHLAFAGASFDVVYSLSSIEHFGGVPGARAAVAEMARVLKPGGILALATEYCLSGPPHHEAFQPAEVHALLDHPDLVAVQPVDERVWDRYDHVPIDLRANPHQTPHMVVTDQGAVFTSVMVFLRKRA